MAENIIRKSDFARLLNLTPTAITLAIKRGDVAVTSNGKIDTDHPKNVQYAALAKAKKKHTRRGMSEERKKAKPIRNKIRELSDDMDKNEDDFSEEYEPKTIVEKLEIEKLKAQTNKLNVSVAKELNILVLRSFVEDTIRRFSTVISSFLLSMGDRVASEVAAICEIEDVEIKLQMKEIIDRDVERTLKAVKGAVRDHWDKVIT